MLLVLGFHLNLPGLFRVGWVGVDLFFVLSGFLISGLLFSDYQKYGEIRLKRFWVRRAFRIIPPLYAFLAVMAAFSFALIRPFPWRNFAASASFSLDYLGNATQGFIGHTWSLGIEEQFYLSLPLLLAGLIALRRLHLLLPIALLIGLACFLFRLHDPHFQYAHLRIDALFVGVLLRYLHDFKPDMFGKASGHYVLVPGLLFFIPAFLLKPQAGFTHSLNYSLIAGCCGCLLAWSIAHDTYRFWNLLPLKLLAALGFYSYSVYLWQQPITLIIMEAFPHSIVAIALGFALAISTGIAMARLIEMPALAMRERLGAGNTDDDMRATPASPRAPQSPYFA